MINRLLWSLSATLLLIFCFVSWLVVTTPNVSTIKGCLKTVLFHVWLCDDASNKAYVSLAEISPYLKNLILISEDAAFYGHSGFDWDELRNSLELNISRGRAVRGGSTITQQLAKNVFLTNEKTLTRKIREAILTVQIETTLTKDKIFEKYLNVIELGPNVYGVEMAAHYYFNKPAKDLNLLESAYLTFLIPNPKVYSRAFAKSQITKYGRYRILDLCFRLLQTKRISLEQYLAAKNGVDLFPWQSLPENVIIGLAGAAAPVEIHDAIEESTFQNSSGENLSNPEVEPDADSASGIVPDDEPAAVTPNTDISPTSGSTESAQ